MGVPFGYNTVLGFGEETVWGTGVAATGFIEINNESMVLEQAPIEKPTLRGAAIRHYVPSKRTVSGGINFPFPFEGPEVLLKHVTGGTPVGSQVGVSTAYTTTFPFADNPQVGLSVYVARDTAAGNSAARYVGCQMSNFTMTQEVENHLTIQLDMVGRDETFVPTESPTYPAANFAHWNQITTLTVDGTTIPGRMTEFVVESPSADDRFKLGDRLRKGIGRSGPRKVTGKIEVEYEYGATYINYRNQSEVAVSAVWTGPEIETGVYYGLSVVLPRCVLGGSTPTAQDHGPLTVEYPFQAFYDNTNTADEMAITLTNVNDSYVP